MFGKSKDDNDQKPSAIQQPQRPAAAKPAEQGSDKPSSMSVRYCPRLICVSRHSQALLAFFVFHCPPTSATIRLNC